MALAIQSCGGGEEEPKDECERIRGLIRRAVFRTKEDCGVRGLKERFMDQIYGAYGPDTAEWKRHDQAITETKQEIGNLMDEYNKNNCGGKAPIGKDAEAWIKKPNPTREDYKGRSTAFSNRSILDWEYWKEATGLGGGALVLYLIVSEGSRVVFPARNLAPVL